MIKLKSEPETPSRRSRLPRLFVLLVLVAVVALVVERWRGQWALKSWKRHITRAAYKMSSAASKTKFLSVGPVAKCITRRAYPVGARSWLSLTPSRRASVASTRGTNICVSAGRWVAMASKVRALCRCSRFWTVPSPAL